MNKSRFWLLGGVVAFSGVVLFWFLQGKGPDSSQSVPTDSAPSAKQGAVAENASGGARQVPSATPIAKAGLPPFQRVDSLSGLIQIYGGQDWRIRKDEKGQVKRIMGMRVPLGEISPLRVSQFAKSVGGALGISPEAIPYEPEILQGGPTLSMNSGIRGIRLRQEFQGYPVLDGALNLFVDFSNTEVSVIDRTDFKDIQGNLSAKAPLAPDVIQKKAESILKTSLVSSGPSAPAVSVSASGRPQLVYRFLSGAAEGPSKETREIWVNATTGKPVAIKSAMILD